MLPLPGNAEQWLKARALESDCMGQLPALLLSSAWRNDFTSLSSFVCNMGLTSQKGTRHKIGTQ